MKLSANLTRVTAFSKALALFLFIFLPVLAFLLGVNYQKALQGNNARISPVDAVECSQDSMICPDGSAVGRIAPDCEFAACPEFSDFVPDSGNFCGGIAAVQCPEGYTCRLDGSYPDAGGSCVPETGKSGSVDYSCPEGGYVDCMPGPGPANPRCSSDFLQWARSNCPDFYGAAY